VYAIGTGIYYENSSESWGRASLNCLGISSTGRWRTAVTKHVIFAVKSNELCNSIHQSAAQRERLVTHRASKQRPIKLHSRCNLTFRVHRHLGDELYVTMSSDAGYQFHYAYPLHDDCRTLPAIMHVQRCTLSPGCLRAARNPRIPWHFNFRNALLRKHSIYIVSRAGATNSDTRRR